VNLIFFSSVGWKDWDVERQPLIRSGMPVLVDDDLLFEDGCGLRATVVVNQWLWELPVSGAPSPNTWEVYARALKGWSEFLAEHGVLMFGPRDQLRAALGGYAGYRLAGPLEVRLAESSWNLHVGVVAQFYEWAEQEGHAVAVPFTYAMARRIVEGQLVEVRRNLAKVRAPKPHTTIKYLESDFAELFVRGLEGLLPDGAPDPSFRGLNPGRNTAMAQLVLASGLRRQEFTHLLVYEIPSLPPKPTVLPILLAVAAAIAKGRKQRTTWVSYEALAAVHRYLALERPLAVEGSAWQPDPQLGEPLVVTCADWHGGVINGRRRAWSTLTSVDRLRLVDPAGGSLLLAVQRDGSPFVDWPTVFRRASDDIRARFEPRFPHVKPHRLRHSFALATLELLVAGYYEQAAKLVVDTGDNPALALYLTKSDPMEIVRDLLGHASVTTTEVYLRRLDTARVFRDAYDRASRDAGLSNAVRAEVDAEFDDDDLDVGIDDVVVGA
jgi:site-specific recombinase XerD